MSCTCILLEIYGMQFSLSFCMFHILLFHCSFLPPSIPPSFFLSPSLLLPSFPPQKVSVVPELCSGQARCCCENRCSNAGFHVWTYVASVQPTLFRAVGEHVCEWRCNFPSNLSPFMLKVHVHVQCSSFQAFVSKDWQWNRFRCMWDSTFVKLSALDACKPHRSCTVYSRQVAWCGSRTTSRQTEYSVWGKFADGGLRNSQLRSNLR